MSAESQIPSPNTRKRSRATMQATDTQGAPIQQQPATEDGFVNDNDAAESPGDDDEEEGGKSDKKAGRRKIKIEFIQDKSRRHITFSKRKAGIMKKAYELSTLTGTQVLLLVVSETGLVYTFTTAKLQPLVTQPEGKNLIQACLNAPHGQLPSSMPVGAPLGRPAPQQMQTQAGAGGQNQSVSGMPPPPIGQRNVPGGLAIGGGAGGVSGQAGEDADGERDTHDDVDVEADKRGAPRRRTSGASKQGANASSGQAGAARSPTTPSAHVGAPPQGIPPMGQPSYGAAPGSAGQDGAAGHPAPPVYPMYANAPQTGYYPPPGMAWGQPQGGPPPQPTYRR
ncbi:MCM1 [Sanghuangporus sanghuang]